MADAGKEDLIAREGTVLAAYLDLGADEGTLNKILNKPLADVLKGFSKDV